MKAERATELWKAPPLPKVPATPSYKRPPLCIITPATASKKRTLEDPTAFSYEVYFETFVNFCVSLIISHLNSQKLKVLERFS